GLDQARSPVFFQSGRGGTHRGDVFPPEAGQARRTNTVGTTLPAELPDRTQGCVRRAHDALWRAFWSVDPYRQRGVLRQKVKRYRGETSILWRPAPEVAGTATIRRSCEAATIKQVH